MGKITSTEGATQPGQKIWFVTCFLNLIFLFGPHGVLSVLYALSCAVSLVFCLPTDAAMEPKSHPMLLTKKQMKQEVDRLTTELQLITSQRNERQDHLTFISEDTMENRYSLFQSSWDLQQCHPHRFPLRFWVLRYRTSSVTHVLNYSKERQT